MNLLSYQERLRLKQEGGKTYVWDDFRKKYLVLQPEELVRQLLLYYLMEERAYPKNRIAVEQSLKLGDLHRRCDVLVYDAPMQGPLLLVECKAPQVALSNAVFEQAAQYNRHFRLPYLLITNGLDFACAQIDFERESFMLLPEIPSYENLKS
jgi:hypothetical protein